MGEQVVTRETCQHHRVDNGTWQCVECGTRMISRWVEADSVLSAPNAAACDNPACASAIEDGSYDQGNPPAGCTNPRGVYVPAHGLERWVAIGWRVTYQCDRCHTGGDTTFTQDGTIWGCGQVHRGDYVRAASEYHEGMTDKKSEDTPKTADDGNKTQRQEGDGLGQRPTEEPKRTRAADSPYAS